VVAWFAVRGRRWPAARFLVAALGIVAVLELGAQLIVRGRTVVTLPYDLVVRLPFFNNLLPSRFAVLAALAAAVILALWTRASPPAAAVVLPLLVIASLAPAAWTRDYYTVPERLPFFTQGLYKACIPRGETVAIFPFGFWGNSMLWQAESGFWFDQAGGYLRPKPPADNLRDPTVQKLTYTTDPPTIEDAFGLAQRKGPLRLIVVETYQHPPGTDLHRVGPIQGLGGVLVAPACGYPPLGPRSKLAPATPG
jgi:hypothetical protein